MDLNQLLYAHQIALMEIGAIADGPDEQSCADKIALIAEQIRQLRDHDPVPQAPLSSRAAHRTLICATYAGPPKILPADEELQIWESEGGSLAATVRSAAA